MKKNNFLLISIFGFFIVSCGTMGDTDSSNNDSSSSYYSQSSPSSSSYVTKISSSSSIGNNYPPPSSSSSSSGGTKCGIVEYNPATHYCYTDNEIYPRCGTTQWYNPDGAFCYNNVAYEKCGGKIYNPTTQDCCGISILDGERSVYNKATQFCSSYKIYSKCGGKEYTPTNQECEDDIIFATFTDSRDNKTYKSVVIGTQTWMAENLNYMPARGSKCPGENDANCSKYGRQYNWATAMGLESSYNSTAFNSSEKRQGICPASWHLPSDSEWNTLGSYVGTNPETKLRAKSGWGTNGTDNYGFGALPSGYIEYGTFNDVAKDVGTRAIWWTTKEYSAGYSYNKTITNTIFGYFGNAQYDYSMTKNNMLSVRCVKD